jgi:hypothetical protein
MQVKNTYALPLIVGVIFLLLGLVLAATPGAFLAMTCYVLAALLIGISIGYSQRK